MVCSLSSFDECDEACIFLGTGLFAMCRKVMKRNLYLFIVLLVAYSYQQFFIFILIPYNSPLP